MKEPKNHNNQLVIIQAEYWEEIKSVLTWLKENFPKAVSSNTAETENYIPATMFMERTFMSRSNFDELRRKNKVRVLQKERKLFVPESEIKRYFEGK